ncbi:sulfurtransferase TusA family protein [Microtetraspora niveoalba]|uniref:sulfurtransferase TusA family protein n=1 Tax=Microtetraspora niveoalba TaxID=46175 RepID=UPI001FDEBBB9|nr:sulfurtransferase TusA family protein [Microtetraspora niveoalba]
MRAGDDPVVLDGGDRRCVRLLIELRRLVEGLEPGRVVHLIASDPAAAIDLPAWCHLTGHDYLGPVPGGAGSPPSRPIYALRVQAHTRLTHEDAPWRLTGTADGPARPE